MNAAEAVTFFPVLKDRGAPDHIAFVPVIFSRYTLRRIEHLRPAVVRKRRALEESARSWLRGLAAESAASKEAERRIKEEAILSGSGRAKA